MPSCTAVVLLRRLLAHIQLLPGTGADCSMILLLKSLQTPTLHS